MHGSPVILWISLGLNRVGIKRRQAGRKITTEWYQLSYAGMIRIRFQESRLIASSQPIYIGSPSDVII
jgi:hypothetical protein